MGLGKVLLTIGKVAAGFGPSIVHMIEPRLDPIAGSIAQGIEEAESIPSATGSDKLTHVIGIGHAAAATFNAANPHNQIDQQALDRLAMAISGTVQAANGLIKHVDQAQGPVTPAAAGSGG